MQKQTYHLQNKHINLWFHVRDRLVYIPGALILIYGFWLSLTA